MMKETAINKAKKTAVFIKNCLNPGLSFSSKFTKTFINQGLNTLLWNYIVTLTGVKHPKKID